MTKNSYNQLLKSKDNISSAQLVELENLLLVFPFSQNIRQLYLKSLYQNEHYKFEKELKKTAVYSNNRRQLKSIITGEASKNKFIRFEKITFHPELIQKTEVEEEKPFEIAQKVEHPDLTELIHQTIVSEVINASISIEVTPEISPKIEVPKKEVIEEKLSFTEWLKKTKEKQVQIQQERSDFKRKAESLIEDFISKQPKIVPKRDFYSPLNMAKKSVEENNELASETLAAIYAQQGNYSKAIKTYETLILKFPEKMAFFADQIKLIKNLPKK